MEVELRDCGLPSNLVAKRFGRHDRHGLDNSFVVMEIERETGVVFLDDAARGLFHGFGTNSALGRRW